MLDLSAEKSALARLADGRGPLQPIPKLSTQEMVRWFQRNKYSLLAVHDVAPSWLRQDPEFQRAVAAEKEWYLQARGEYVVVRDAWLEQGITCLMIKATGCYPSFPHTSDNIDILVRPEQGRSARDVLRRLGYVEVRNVEEPQKFLFRKFHDGACVSAIHVHERVAWFVGFMDEEALWAGSRSASDDSAVNVPSPEEAVLINLAHACYENKQLRLVEIARVRHALRVAGARFDWAHLERVAASRGWLDGLAFLMLVYAGIERCLDGVTSVPEPQVRRFERMVEDVNFVQHHLHELKSRHSLDLPLDLSYPFCKRLYYRKIFADPTRSPKQRWSDAALTLLWGIKLKSRIRPQPGAILTLSGPDGSGKTAHAQALVEALRLCEIKADYLWTRGGSSGLLGVASRLRHAVVPGTTARDGADHLARRRRGLALPIARFAWSWLVAADQIATYWLRARLPAAFGRVVVTDRYVYDAAVEMDLSLPANARWSRLAIDGMLAAAPQPRASYVLDVSPETARARKGEEVWHDDPQGERVRYRELAVRNGLQVVSTEGTFAESNDRLIHAVLMSYMARFETRLNSLFRGNPSQKNAPDPIWVRGGTR